MSFNNLKIIQRTGLIILISVVLGLVSCIDDVDDVDLPHYDPKIVVSAFIAPGDSVKITLFRSVPIYYNLVQVDWMASFPRINDASIVIVNTSDNSEITIPYIPGLELYALDPAASDIRAGVEYELRISAPGLESVKSRTFVPESAPGISNLKVEKRNVSYGEEVTITGLINDPPGIKNYYFVIAYEVYAYQSWVNDSLFEVAYSYQNYYNFFSDSDRDGQDIGFRVTNQFGEGSLSYELFVLSVDEHYYRYHSSLNNYYETGDNPFAEAVLLSSNVESGLGVFGSFNKFRYEVDLSSLK
jgi:hypothetical protein